MNPRKQKTSMVILIIILPFIFFLSCSYEKIPIPDFPDTLATVFDPGKIKYIPLNPPWSGSEYSFVTPVDIFISIDDYIFVADSSQGRIYVLNKSGEIVSRDDFGNDFSALDNLIPAGESGVIHPTGICVDSKLNLFIVGGSNRIYVWNQFINNRGIDSVAVSLIYYHPDKDEYLEVTDYSETVNLENEGYYLYRANYVAAPALIDSLKAVHMFYTQEGHSKFVSVGAAPFGFNQIYVADDSLQRIAIIALKRSAYLKLADGTTVWQHRGELAGYAALEGTGAGTVNRPRGIFVDNNNNIYYTQVGENFGVHKIRYSSGYWATAFNLGQNQIMDLGRFNQPYDVAVDQNGHIFVTNSGDNELQEFDANGQFVRRFGLREVQIDTTITDTLINILNSDSIPVYDTTFVQRDTLILRYYNDLLSFPRGVFIDEDVVYVLDTGNQRIMRFKLSSDIDIELPQ